MCDSLKFIRNRRLDYNPLVHAYGFTCSCGKCESCVNEKKEDYANRASFEAQKYIQKGGAAVFLLFTYSPEAVPMLTYNNESTMCFNLAHIYELNRILKDRYTKQGKSISYIIGPEYGVDPSYTQRPHYHAEYMLDEGIDPNEFTEFCRKIWQGEPYWYKMQGNKRVPMSWKYGHLGLMLPKIGECRVYKKHIVKDLGAAAVYAAKYAVKQVGFYNKPVIVAALKNKDFKSCNIRCFPRVITSQHFGFSMLDDPSCDLVKGTVFNKFRNRTIRIPSYVLSSALYKRYFLGRIKHEETIAYNKQKFKAIMSHMNERGYYPTAEEQHEIFKSCEMGAVWSDVKQYDRVLTARGFQVKCAQMVQRVEDLKEDFIHHFHWPEGKANRFAVWHLIYSPLPLTSLLDLEDAITAIHQLFDRDNWLTIYKDAYLLKGVLDFEQYADVFQHYSYNDFMFEAMPDMYDEYYSVVLPYVYKQQADRISAQQARVRKINNGEKLKNMLKSAFHLLG